MVSLVTKNINEKLTKNTLTCLNDFDKLAYVLTVGFRILLQGIRHQTKI